MKISGIYQILCTVTNKIYIGSSIDVCRRIQNHKASLRNNRHSNSYLQRAWKKYGEINFLFELIEKTPNLLEREKFYFNQTRCCEEDSGFNLSEVPGAGITKTGPKHFNYGRKHTGKALENIIAAINSRPDGWREKIYVKTRGRKETNEVKKRKSLASGKRKLSPEQVGQIKSLIGTVSQKQIATMFNVAPCTISMIKTGRSNKFI